MNRVKIVLLVLLVMVGSIAGAAFAVDGEGVTCTNDSADGSGLPSCLTPDDNECYPGGVLYREENQDGCLTEWHWKAGWYLARFNDGALTRDQVPAEFQPVLPPLEEEDESAPARAACQIVIGGAYGTVTVPQAVLDVDPSSIDQTYTAGYDDGTYTWGWHNSWDLGFPWPSDSYHLYSTLTHTWAFPTIGDCTVNEANLP